MSMCSRIPESALSARLQHRASGVFLAVSSAVAVSVERVFPAVFKLSFRPVDRAGKMRLLCLCWAGFLLTFFTFFLDPGVLFGAVLRGTGAADRLRHRRSVGANPTMVEERPDRADGDRLRLRAGSRWILTQVWNISRARRHFAGADQQPIEAYTLSLGHMGDLTLASFAYLRAPLELAGVAFLLGAALTLREASPGQWS